MIYNNNYKNFFSFTEDNLEYCYDKSISFKTKKYTYENIDLLVIPLYGKKIKKIALKDLFANSII